MVLPREAFLEFIRQTPDAAFRLLEAMSRQYVRRLTDTVYDAAFLDVPARLARTLVHLIEAQGEKPEFGLTDRAYPERPGFDGWRHPGKHQ